MTEESAAAPTPTGASQRMRFAWGPVVAIVLLVAAIGAIAWLHLRQAPTFGGPFELIDAWFDHALKRIEGDFLLPA